MDDEQIESRINQGLFRSLESIAAYTPTTEGVMTGLQYIDRLTGGLRPGKLNFVAGYSHHGKTALMLTTLIHNIDEPDFTALIISGDDTDDMLLTKLIAFREEMTTEQVEATSPKWRIEYVKSNFKGKLLIATPQLNDAYSIENCVHVYYEACNEFGVEPTYAIFDYIALLKTNEQGTAMDVRLKARVMKSLIRARPNTVWVVGTQCNKAADETAILTMNHMEYGGHQEADGVIIGCRKQSQGKMSEYELREDEHCKKVYLSVMKNKITGRSSTNAAGVPYAFDQTSGMIRELTDQDRANSSKSIQGIGQLINFTQPSRKAING